MLLGVDVGGTFTDAVLVRTDGSIRTAKARSTPEDQSIGVLAAVAAALGDADGAASVTRFAHGMTVATNALLEGRGARTALLATAGFTDLVELGRQARPQLYRLCASPPSPLAPPELRFPVPERMTPTGPLRPLDVQAATALVTELGARAPEAIAVALLHSYAHPEHELLLGELLRKLLPHVHVTLSHQLVGTFREYERAASAEIDASLSPLLAGYLRRLGDSARAASLPQPQIMQSSGGLIDAETAASHAALTVLSGPAGGVGGALLLAERAGERNLLCLDMGGTSCDVCLILDGKIAETATREIAGRPLALPSLDIHTVGAGGGSIAWRDGGGALRVGPRSAGADPGPACYGLGGREPTVTDANLLLGRLPAGLALAGDLVLDREAAERAVAGLAKSLGLDTLACAEGIVRIAELEMLRALRVMSVERGVDPRGLALMCFGGAGPLHAAALATELGIPRVLCPSASGVLCALGLAAAAPRRDAARTVMLSGPELDARSLDAERKRLIERVVSELGCEPAELRLRAELRYRGQSFELSIEAGPATGPEQLRGAFSEEHERRYGYRDEDAEIELVTLRVSAIGPAPELRLAAPETSLSPGRAIAGPAVCPLPGATLYVPAGWSGSIDAHGTIVLDAQGSQR